MSGKKKFEEQLAALDALRREELAARIAPLRKALTNRNNFVVAKSSDLAREFELKELTPDLLAAFARMFDDPVKTDPQCWAKNAISKALAAFELQDAEVFLRGMKHIQHEPTWGGPSDSAGTLRATCAFGLVQCREVREKELLEHLVDLAADKDKAVRAEVVRAIEQVGSPSAALLLRLRATVGAQGPRSSDSRNESAEEPEVLGACYAGVLRIEGVRAIPWVHRFLAEADDAAAEAALAIAGTHSMEAFEALRVRQEHERDPWFRQALMSAIALTRQEAALEFLLETIGQDGHAAEGAIEAICRSGASEEAMGRLKKAVERNARLAKVLAAQRTGR